MCPKTEFGTGEILNIVTEPISVFIYEYFKNLLFFDSLYRLHDVLLVIIFSRTVVKHTFSEVLKSADG